MKKINVSNYDIDAVDKEGKKVKVPYSVKGSLEILMFHPDLRLSSLETVRHNKIMAKIEDCKDDNVLLEDSEYEVVKRAVETVKGYGRNDIRLIDRVMNAETVEVKEK